MTKFEQTGLTAPFTAQSLSPYNESSLAEGYADYMVIAGDGESIVCDRMTETVANLIADLLNTRAASVPSDKERAEQDTDYCGVDRLSTAMKEKLHKKRLDGRSGWQGMGEVELNGMLFEHLKKGDPVDVANFCMMLFCNNQKISAPAHNGQAQIPSTEDNISYVSRYGGFCRDCADENGICPTKGLPCGEEGSRAIRHVIEAINYGIKNNFLPDPLTAPDQSETIKALKDAVNGLLRAYPAAMNRKQTDAAISAYDALALAEKARGA